MLLVKGTVQRFPLGMFLPFPLWSVLLVCSHVVGWTKQKYPHMDPTLLKPMIQCALGHNYERGINMLLFFFFLTEPLLLFSYQNTRKEIDRKGFPLPQQLNYAVAEQIHTFNYYENHQHIMVVLVVQLIGFKRLGRLVWEGCCRHWWILAVWQRQASALSWFQLG